MSDQQTQEGLNSGDESIVANILAERRAKAHAQLPGKRAEIAKVSAAPENDGEEEAIDEGGELPPEDQTVDAQQDGEPDPEQEAEEASPETEDGDSETSEDDKQKFSVSTDEGERKVSLNELRGGYMRQADYTRKTQELAETRKAFESDLGRYSQVRDATLGELQSLAQMMIHEMIEGGKSINLDQLRQHDPAEYAAVIGDRQRKQALLERVLAQRNNAVNHDKERSQAQQEQYTREERRKLVMAVPQWSDPKKFAEEAKQVATYLGGIGFTKDEIESLVDHRQVITARKAMLYDRLQAKKQEIRKTNRAETPTRAAQSAGVKSNPAGSVLVEAQKAFRKNPTDLEAAARLLAARRSQNMRRKA